VFCSLDGQTYSIQVNRHPSVGQIYAVSGSGSSRQLLSTGDRVLKAQEFQVTFEAQAKVEGVDKSGDPYRVAFTVARLSKTVGSATIDLLKPGTVVIADGSRTPHLTLKDGTMQKEVQDAFEVIYSAHQPDTSDDDAWLGTNQPRSVGETWPINAAVATSDLQRQSGITISPDQLSGTASFAGINKLAGADCAHLTIQVRADNFSAKEIAPGISAKRASFTAELGGCFPIPKSALSFTEKRAFNVQFEASRPDGVTMEARGNFASTSTWLARGETP
jgi:hypothetical protein